MKLLSKLKISQLPEDLYRKLLHLNFRHEGTMQECLIDARFGTAKAYAYVLMDDADRVVSWALVTFPFAGERDVHFYTRADSRRKGYGTQIGKAVTKDFGRNLAHFPHDQASAEFYDSINLNGEFCEGM